MRALRPTPRVIDAARDGGARRPRCRRDDEAVSDVVGSILLVGITVTMAAALGLLLLNFDGPKERPEASLALTVRPGLNAWGSGDERLQVRHLGGDALRASDTVILYSINGSSAVALTGSQLGFANGRLAIGQTWTSGNLTLSSAAAVDLRVIHRGATGVLLAGDTLTPGQVSSTASCPLDTAIPGATWVQTPSNLTIASTGPVTLNLTLTDDCAGVSPTAVPRLYWSLTPASPSDAGNMTSLGNNQWQAIIQPPGGGWAAQGLKSLQYYASPLADNRGNSGQSGVRTDLIELSGATHHYVTTASVVAPTPALAGSANLNAEDGNSASLGEGIVGSPCSPGTVTLSASNPPISLTGWSTSGATPQDTTSSNNGWRTNSNTAPAPLRVGFPDPTAGCTITSVEILLEQSVTRYTDDGWTVQACVAGGGCGTATPFQASGVSAGQSAPNDAILTFALTTVPPPGGAWTWAAINNLEVSVNPTLQGSKDNNGGTSAWRIDHIQVRVTSVQTYTATLQLDWTGLPGGNAHYLDLRTQTPADEAYHVWVWNWTASSYVQRGTLASGSGGLTQFAYLLTAQELQAGAVRVQVRDANPNDTTPSTLLLDYARVDRV